MEELGFFFFFFFYEARPCAAPNEPWWILHRQSIPGEAVKKTLLYLGAGTAQTDSNCCDSKARRKRESERQRERERERERGMFTISTWQQSKLHTSWSHLLWIVARRKRTMEFAVKIERSVWVLLTTQNNCLVNATLLVNPKWIHKLKLCF